MVPQRAKKNHNYFSGASSLIEAVSSVGVEVGDILAKKTSSLDKERIRRADKASLNESKMQRKKSALSKNRREEAIKAAEGNLYEAGGH